MRQSKVGTNRTARGLLGVAVLVVAGCGLFDIREPVEPPVEGSGPPHRNPVEPGDVLFNFSEAVKFKLDGLSQYEEALAADFQLILDGIDAQDLGAGIDSLDRETDVSSQRIRASESEADSFHFAFGNEPVVDEGDIARYFDIQYTLTVIDQQTDSTTSTVTGRAVLTLRQDLQTTLWSLTRWEDKRIGDAVSLGKWHGEKAVGP